MSETETQFREREAIAKKEGFAKFLDQPAIRMMCSMIPAGERQDVFQILLQEAFNAGFGCGFGVAVGDVMRTVIKGLAKKDDQERR